MTEKKDNLIMRAPIVVVVGHIDHGKTTLLDHIRKTKVTERESGGITQHMDAYEVEIPNKDGKICTITFIDTPGHEAFSQMRLRGAKIADVAILIVAADDGVMEQTKEALQAIKEAGVPFVVAINKIDKENANVEKVKNDLSQEEIYIEGLGGKIPCVEISAKAGHGVSALLETVLLLAELEDLKTDTMAPATGFVLESHIDKKRGIAATLIIQNGILKQGECISVRDALSPVRVFENFLGQSIKEAGASSPVHVVGFNKLPEAGVQFESFGSKKEAESVFNTAGKEALKTCEILAKKQLLDEDTEETKEPEEDQEQKLIIPIVVKADVAGSVEALLKQIKKLENEKIKINILKSDVGDITEDDIKLASSGENAIILGFRVKCTESNRFLSEKYKNELKLFDIIYELEEWLSKEIEKRIPKEQEEQIVGNVKILKIFSGEKNKKTIGGEVLSGKIVSGKYAKIKRRDFELGVGKILELKKFQTTVNEAAEGEQVGILIQTKIEIVPKDTLDIFEEVIK